MEGERERERGGERGQWEEREQCQECMEEGTLAQAC